MKKQLITILTIILLILGIVFSVNAADYSGLEASASLNVSKQELIPGEEFTVTFNGECEKRINAITTTISYDENKLELVEGVKVTDATKWVKLEGETDLSADILSNTSDKIISGDIFTVKFKVKENAEVGTTAKIIANDIYIDSDEEDSYELGAKEIEVSIIEKTTPTPTPEEKILTGIEITKAPTKTTYNTGEKFDKAGMKVIAKYSDGTSKEITNYTYTPSEALKTSDTKVTVSYTEDGVTKTAEQKITIAGVTSVKKDGTETKKEIPYTGAQNYIAIIAIAVGTIAIVSYIKLKQYKNI